MIIQIGELYLNLAPSVLAAIGAGVGLVLIILIICCCWCCCRRKDRKDKEGGQKIHVENAPQVKGNQNRAQQWQHQSNPPRVAAAVAASPSLQPPNVALTPLHRQSSMSSTSGSPLPPHSAKKSPSPQPQSPFNMSQSIGDSIISNGSSIPPHSPVPSFASSQTMFSYEELVMATNGFSKGNILGQGGFGFVHKGVLPTGKEIAVKSLKADSGQGEREFQAEVEIISRVHHRHLVSLVGYCITGSHRLLVYELVPNKTLEFHLHGAEPALDWPTRMKIAIGAAKGLAYLHEDCHPRIIHRDIKAANILIDNNFEAKVADFGLAKLHSLTETHITTRVMGTLGYLAPEYASSGKLTDKSDVYSFGVMLLELITGRLPVDRTREKTINLVEWARPLLTAAVEDENFNALVDPRIQYCYKHTEMSRMVYCAATCARKSSRRRPQMSQIVRALEGNISLSDLTAGISPGRSMMNRYDSSSGYSSSQYTGASKGYGSSAEYSARQYKGDSRGYESTGISTGERYITTGEHDGTTSEYGLYASSSSSEDQTTRVLDTEEVKREIRRPQRRYF